MPAVGSGVFVPANRTNNLSASYNELGRRQNNAWVTTTDNFGREVTTPLPFSSFNNCRSDNTFGSPCSAVLFAYTSVVSYSCIATPRAKVSRFQCSGKHTMSTHLTTARCALIRLFFCGLMMQPLVFTGLPRLSSHVLHADFFLFGASPPGLKTLERERKRQVLHRKKLQLPVNPHQVRTQASWCIES